MLSFYTRTSDAGPDGIKLASVKVIPPDAEDPPGKREKHLQAVLERLFKECNFEHPPIDTSGFSDSSTTSERYAGPGDITLANFLKGAIAKLMEEQKQKNSSKVTAEYLSLQQEKNRLDQLSKELLLLPLVPAPGKAPPLSASRLQMEFSFQIHEHTFMDGIEKYKKRIRLLQRLYNVLCTIKASGYDMDKLFKGTIVFSSQGKTGIDNKGRLILQHIPASAVSSPSHGNDTDNTIGDQYDKEWELALVDSQPEKVTATVKRLDSIAKKHEAIAKSLGIASWNCVPSLEDSFDYESFVKRLEQHILQNKYMWDFNDILPLPSDINNGDNDDDDYNSNSKKTENKKPAKLDRSQFKILAATEPGAKAYYTVCTVGVNIDTPLNDMSKFLRDVLPHCIASFHECKEIVSIIKQTYNLRALTYDVPPHLTVDQFSECANRLLSHQNLFLPIFGSTRPAGSSNNNGLHIHIGNRYGINKEAGVISIPWNYLI